MVVADVLGQGENDHQLQVEVGGDALPAYIPSSTMPNPSPSMVARLKRLKWPWQVMVRDYREKDGVDVGESITGKGQAQ